MLQKLKHYFKEFLLFIIIMTLFANAISLYKSSDLNKTPFTLTNINLINNQKYTLDDTKPTLVHFWAVWCPTCKIEASNIEYVAKDYQVLTIAVKSGSNEDIQKWMNENEFTFNVVNDSSGFIASNYNLGAFPTTFIYNKNKELVFSDVGYTSTWGLYIRMWWASI